MPRIVPIPQPLCLSACIPSPTPTADQVRGKRRLWQEVGAHQLPQRMHSLLELSPFTHAAWLLQTALLCLAEPRPDRYPHPKPPPFPHFWKG